MSFAELVKAALELGVIPALALFLVAAMYLQNRRLIKDRREMEAKLLNSVMIVLADYRALVAATYMRQGKTNQSIEDQSEDSRTSQ